MIDLIVTFETGERYRIPAQYIIEEAAKYRAKHDSMAGYDTFENAFKNECDSISKDDDEIIDWAKGNMNWSDVSRFAVFLDKPTAIPSFEEEWCNAEMKVDRHD